MKRGPPIVVAFYFFGGLRTHSFIPSGFFKFLLWTVRAGHARGERLCGSRSRRGEVPPPLVKGGKKLTKKKREKKRKSRKAGKTQSKTRTNQKKERRKKEARALVEVRNGKAERKEGGKKN